VGLERGPLSLVSATEELPGRKIRGVRPRNRRYKTANSFRSIDLQVIRVVSVAQNTRGRA
jgi:hypothetical protein